MNFIKADTSRDSAELDMLLEVALNMRVIEVPRGTVLSEQSLGVLVQEQSPVVFRGLADQWKCVEDWAKPGYLKRAAEEEAKGFNYRKYRQFTAHSAESGRLHLTDGKAKAKPVNILEFLTNADVEDETTDGLYLLGIHAVGSNAGLSYCPVQRHVNDGDKTPPLCRDVPTKIDFLKWYSKILGRKGEPVKYDHQQFFLTKGHAFTDFHYDSYDNFYVAVTGTRRWTLAAPDASRWLIDSGAGSLKSESVHTPHQGKFSHGSFAQIYPFSTIDLTGGDVLFLPACWWHSVESIPGEDGFSSAFNFFFSKPPDDVFAAYQHRLSQIDVKVGIKLGECKVRLAERPIFKQDFPVEMLTAPKAVPQVIWDSLIDFMRVHGLSDNVQALYKQHASNCFRRVAAVVRPRQRTDCNGHARKRGGRGFQRKINLLYN